MAVSAPRDAFRQFTTGVALITTHGAAGENVMAAEWTFHVSYDPFLISVHIRPGKATYLNIQETGEFGVNIVSEELIDAMSFAGHFTGHEVDKMSSTLFETYPAAKIGASLIRGALLNAECRVVQEVPMGDHTAFVGRVVAFTTDDSKRPVTLHKGARRAGDRMRRDPIVGVAATHSTAASGTTIQAVGELMARDNASKPVALALLDGNGEELAATEVATDGRGRFRAELPLPETASTGSFRIVARYDAAEGHARVTVKA